MVDGRAARHARTRERVLAAAWELTRARGPAGWTLRELAGAVGMRAPSLYVYFDGKDAIYDAMYAAGNRELLAAAEAADLGGSPTEQLRALAHVFVGFAVTDPARFQLLFQRVVPGFVPSDEAYATAEKVLRRLRERLRELGADDPAATDVWTALLTGLASQQLANDPGGDRWTRLVDRSVDMFVSEWLPATAGAAERP